MSQYFRAFPSAIRGLVMPAVLIAWKDILLELRTKDVIGSVIIFAIMVTVVFNFALNVTPQLVNVMAPGILWVSFTFAGIIAMNRTFTVERDHGSLDGVILCPISRDSIYFGKMISALIFLLIMEAVLLLIFAGIFNFQLISLNLVVTMGLASIGFAAVGTLFAAMSVNTRSREIMLPILFLPVVAPVIIGGVEASIHAVSGNGFSQVLIWWRFLVIFDVVYLVICPWVFHFVLEE